MDVNVPSNCTTCGSILGKKKCLENLAETKLKIFKLNIARVLPKKIIIFTKKSRPIIFFNLPHFVRSLIGKGNLIDYNPSRVHVK